jgi:hypothetical protein
MADLSTIKPRLTKLVLMLSSGQPGEVFAAAAAIERALKSAGADWHDLANQLTETPHRSGRTAEPPPRSKAHGTADAPWRVQLDYCLARIEWLSSREQDFMGSLKKWRGTPTDRQLSWLASIHRKLQRCDGI